MDSGWLYTDGLLMYYWRSDKLSPQQFCTMGIIPKIGKYVNNTINVID